MSAQPKLDYWQESKQLAHSFGLTLPSLREHQQAAYLGIRNAVGNQVKRSVLMAPCSFGKTVLAAYIACQSVMRDKRVLFCVDNLELVAQTIETFERCGLTVGVIQGNHPQYNPSARVQIATIQTIDKRIAKHPEQWGATPFHTIFIDETHQWHKGIDALAATYPDAVFVGLSGTPWRRGLGEFYSELISTITVPELLDQGWLAPVDVYSHPCPSWAGVKTSGGDYVLSQAAREYTPVLMGDVVSTWEKTCADLSTIVFACDKAHAAAMAAEFCQAGYTFVAVDGDTDTDERKEIIAKFKSGKIQGISTCLIAIKGFDATIAACMVDVQPTKSLMRHYQKIGRIQRIHEGKERSVALDFAGNFIRNGLPTDELPTTLHDGKKETKRTDVRDEDAPLPKPCAACSFLKPPKTLKCPACGFKPTAMESPEHEAGVLELLTGETRHAKRIEVSVDEKRRWYAEMLHFAWSTNRKPGWAYYAFQAKFEHKPNGYKKTKAQDHSIEVAKWCESHARKSSKAHREKKAFEAKQRLEKDLAESERVNLVDGVVTIDGHKTELDAADALDICETNKYPCNRCGDSHEIECEVWELDPDYHYCGKNQWCMP